VFDLVFGFIDYDGFIIACQSVDLEVLILECACWLWIIDQHISNGGVHVAYNRVSPLGYGDKALTSIDSIDMYFIGD
jgi:hypothetical protein